MFYIQSTVIDSIITIYKYRYWFFFFFFFSSDCIQLVLKPSVNFFLKQWFILEVSLNLIALTTRIILLTTKSGKNYNHYLFILMCNAWRNDKGNIYSVYLIFDFTVLLYVACMGYLTLNSSSVKITILIL